MTRTHCFRPTRCPPGSSGKIDVLIFRARLRLPLWHPLDAKFDDGARFLPAMFEAVDGDDEEALSENYRRFLEAYHGETR